MMSLKKIVVIVCILYLIAPRINSQQYVPFPLPGAEWKFAVYDDLNCQFSFCGYYYNKIEGDTVIGNYLYKKVLQTALNGSEYYYIAGVIQDTLTGKVYVKLYDNNFCGETDTLLYDFSLHLGDTLQQCSDITGCGDGCFVTNIDSVKVGNYWLNQFTANYGISIIEGIGCLGGLIEGWTGWEFGYNILSCYSINGEPVFPDTTCIMTNVEYSNCYGETEVMVYPNPINDFGTIDIQSNITSNIIINLYNIIANRKENIFSGVLSKGKNKIEIKAMDNKSGLYVLQILDTEKNIMTCKLISIIH
jgi:hypothetical protein